MEKNAIEKNQDELEVLINEVIPDKAEDDVSEEDPRRSPGNKMIPNQEFHPHIVNALNTDGLDLVFRSIWVAKICRLDSVIARTSGLLLAISTYGGGAVVLQETLEKYTGASPSDQVLAIELMVEDILHPEVKLGIQTMLDLMHDYCHLKSCRGDDLGYVGEGIELDAKLKVLAQRAYHSVYSDHLPF